MNPNDPNGLPPIDQTPPPSTPPDPPPSPAAAPGTPQPVAYDQYGRPLYAHPPAPMQYNPQPQPQQVVHISRSINPISPHIPAEIVQRHEASRKKYPHLNLSNGEYIISAVKRHPIGLLKIWGLALVLMIAFGSMFAMFFIGEDPLSALANPEEISNGALVGLGLLFVIVSLGAAAAAYVYNANTFFLTNESVIQEIQSSLFSKHEQTVSLSNIEDASYKQGGILPTILNYGTIRLSTEGDETTYMFTYVTDPKKHIAVLNNAVEAFKNGRPVD